MLKIIVLIFILILSIGIPALSQETDEDRQELVIPNYKNKLITSTENQIIRSTLIRVSAEQKEYEMVFKDRNVDINQPYLFLSIDILEVNKSEFKIELSILSLKTKKIIKKIIADPFDKRFIIKKFEMALRVLFNMAKITDLNPEEKETIIERKERISKKKVATKNNAREQEKKTIDFKKRILNIKIDLPKTIKKEKEKIAEEEKRKKKNTNKNNENISTKKDNNEITLPIISDQKKWNRKYTLYAEYITESLKIMDSRNGFDEVIISNQLNFYSISALAEFIPPQSDDFIFLTQFAIVIPLTQLEDELSRYTEIKLGGRYSLEKIKSEIEVSYYMTSKVFISLPVQGDGLKASKIDSTFIDFTGRKKFNHFFTADFTYLFHLKSENKSSHLIETSNYKFTSYRLGLIYNFEDYLQESSLYARIKQESFDNGSLVKGNSTSFILGIEKKF